jgi:mannose-6-phosphate isomerase-like protein (cupin superfamily)
MVTRISARGEGGGWWFRPLGRDTHDRQNAAGPLSQGLKIPHWRQTIPHQQKKGTGVPSKTITSGPVSIDRAASSGIVSRTSWGEESRIRIGPADSGGQLTILDYRAPASFGPPRHLHHREDEVFELIEGQVVVWTPNLSFVLAPGDLVLLPKLGPHTWRAYGPQAIRFTVTVTPSGFERFFQEIERRRLLASDVAELRDVAGDVGMDILGPPLSDEEVRQILAEAEVS